MGKTTAAAAVARRLGWPWLMVDDLRLALIRSGVPIPEGVEVGSFDAPDGLVAVGEAVAPAIEVVVENHVDQRYPVVIEGDGILPSLFERESVRARATGGRIRAVYLFESDEDALLADLIARGRDDWRRDLAAYARRSMAYGESGCPGAGAGGRRSASHVAPPTIPRTPATAARARRATPQRRSVLTPVAPSPIRPGGAESTQPIEPEPSGE